MTLRVSSVRSGDNTMSQTVHIVHRVKPDRTEEYKEAAYVR